MAAAATGAAFVFPSRRLSTPHQVSVSVPHLRRTSGIKLVAPHSSSSSSSSSSTDTLSAESESQTSLADGLSPPANGGGCRACGREEVERGCNGEGRIQGGIATVPGFGWWPIKAYRPCPGFVASGGRYYRQGQTMDDVVSGTGRARASGKQPSSSSSSSSSTQAYSSSKKKNGQNRSKKRSPTSS